MSTANEIFQLINTTGDSVDVDFKVARELFGIVVSAGNVLAQGEKTFTNDETPAAEEAEETVAEEADADEAEAVKIDTLTCNKKTLEVIKEYAEMPASKRTKTLPKPIDGEFGSHVMAHELKMVKDAEKDGYLVDLLDAAIQLRFSALSDMCAGYCSVRIRQIAQAAPDIMTGAERIREFLHMENEWTPEETEHLRKEMEMLKSLDSSVY